MGLEPSDLSFRFQFPVPKPFLLCRTGCLESSFCFDFEVFADSANANLFGGGLDDEDAAPFQFGDGGAAALFHFSGGRSVKHGVAGGGSGGGEGGEFGVLEEYENDKVLAGFAGSTADAFSLFSRF